MLNRHISISTTLGEGRHNDVDVDDDDDDDNGDVMTMKARRIQKSETVKGVIAEIAWLLKINRRRGW